MKQFTIAPIGYIRADGDGFRIELEEKYARSLEGLEGFAQILVLWWFDQCDNESSRSKLVEDNPYKKGPAILGTFATRSPERPNPIAVSCLSVTAIDKANRVIRLAYADAFDGTPVIDIKPYMPSLDRVETPSVPEWCAHWPNSVELSADFDWESEFNFLET